MLILPAIDLRGGECVRLLHGRFDQVTRYDANPFARVAAFVESGAMWIHIVDLDGAQAGSPQQHRLISQLARSRDVQIQAGGGVRTAGDIQRLLEAGVSRVVIGSAAVQRPEQAIEWLDRFGPDHLTLAMDVNLRDGRATVASQGWLQDTQIDLWQALDRLDPGRPRHLLATDISRDGALEGPNLPLTRELLQRRPDLEIQASGGVASLDDIRSLAALGVQGVIVGRALYEGRFTLEEAIDAG